ncbi:hypothetical protein Tco_1262584 [Tanacetum coccineum]
MPHQLRRLSHLRPTSLRPHHHHILHTALLAQMSIRDEPPIPFWSEAEIARLLTIPSPPPSPLSPCSSPPPQIPSPPLPVSSPVSVSPLPLPTSRLNPLEIIACDDSAKSRGTIYFLSTTTTITNSVTPSTYILTPRSEAPPSGTPPLLPIPLPTPSPPLLLPSTDRESSSAFTARPDGDFRRDYGFIATLDDEIMRDPKRDVGYGITDTWDKMLVGMPGALATDETELGRRVTDLVMTVRQDTDEVYGRLDDAYTERQMVTSQVNMLVRDRRAHARTTRLMEIEARMSREAWGWFMDASDVDPNEQILNSLA